MYNLYAAKKSMLLCWQPRKLSLKYCTEIAEVKVKYLNHWIKIEEIQNNCSHVYVQLFLHSYVQAEVFQNNILKAN